MTKKFSLPSVLAYSRKISCSNGLMYSSPEPTMDNAEAITKEFYRTTSSNGSYRTPKDLKDKKINLLDKNIQNFEYAKLKHDHDWLITKTSFIFSKGEIAPHSCNDPEFLSAVNEFVKAYTDKTKFKEVAEAYAANIVTGRWLWRNLELSMNTIIDVNNVRYELQDDSHTPSAIKESQMSDFNTLVDSIAKALSEGTGLKINATAFLDIGAGQDVYPSQLFPSDDEQKKKQDNRISKHLFYVNASGVKQVAISSQKVTNAIRWIDVWYDNNEDNSPLPVESYGIDTKNYITRRNQKNNIFSLLENIEFLTESIKDNSITGDHHYVMASLVKGGLYSGSKKG